MSSHVLLQNYLPVALVDNEVNPLLQAQALVVKEYEVEVASQVAAPTQPHYFPVLKMTLVHTHPYAETSNSRFLLH